MFVCDRRIRESCLFVTGGCESCVFVTGGYVSRVCL